MAKNLLISAPRLAMALTVALAGVMGALIGARLAGLPTLPTRPLFASIPVGAAFGACVLGGLTVAALGIAAWWPRQPTMAESRRLFATALDIAIKAGDDER